MGFFIKVKSSIKVAEATTSITVELGDTFFNPTSPLMQIIMESVGEQWNKIELRLLDFMSSCKSPKLSLAINFFLNKLF